MKMGCIRESFTIQNGPYHHKTHIALKNKSQTEVRVTYEGCDYLCLPAATTLPDFFDNTLIKIPSVSNQTLLRCEINGKDRLFYIHKTHRTVLEIHGITIQQVEALARKDSKEKHIDYQPEPIPLEHIQSVANLISYPPLFTHAKCAKNIEIKLTEEQRRLVLMMMDDSNISFRNTSYTYAFQAYLAKYMHESMLQQIELQFEAKHQHLETKTNSLWQSFTHSIKKMLWTSTEEKLTKIEAMQQWTMQLHRLSARFKAFDLFINNRGPNPQTTLNDLKNTFLQYQKCITSDIDDIIKNIAETDPKCRQKKQILTRLKQELSLDMDNFEAQLIKLGNNPTKEQIERLVSITDRDLFIRSLGGFMQAQMTKILRAGIQVSYKISDQRLYDVIQVPRLVAHLSDAKHLMLIKGQSIVEGPKDNDTYSAIPTAMLDATTHAECFTEDSEAKWFSIKPYLKKWNPASVDTILCLITGQAAIANNRHKNHFYHWIVQPLKLFTSIFEIAFAIPRLGLVLSLGLIETIFFMFTWQKKSTELKLTYQLNQWVKQFYHNYAFLVAPLTYLKNSSWNTYQREDNTDNNGDHQRVLNACTDHSGFCYALFIYFTPQLISQTILDFLSAIFRQIISIPQDISYLASYDQQAEDTFKQVQFRYQTLQQLHELLAKRLREAKKPRLIQLTKNPKEMQVEELQCHLHYHKGYIKYKQHLFYFDNKTLQEEHFKPSNLALGKQLHSLMSRLSKDTITVPKDEEMRLFVAATGRNDTPILDSYEPLSYCVINHISSPLDVFYDIMVTLSNGVVNPMFRKSPGIATFFFAISISTFATYLLPAPALAWLKSIPAWLKYPAEQISLHFTGKSTALGVQEQLVACFLEWKLGFFATEFGVELLHGHFEILEPLFEEPEQIVLGLVGLIGLGVTLQYVPELPTTIHIPGLPEIPNYYFMVVNVFTEEAKGCADGTMVCTSIEYGFLGLKFAMLMHSMLSGSESHQEPTALQKLVLACGQKSFFKKIMRSSHTMALSQWLQDPSFVRELDTALSDTDSSIFATSQTKLNPKISSFATMLTRVVNQTLAEQNLHFEEHELDLFKTALAKQILAMPEFLSLNAARKKVQKALVPGERTTPSAKTYLKPQKQPTLTLEEAYQALREAINMTKNPEHPLVFAHQGFGLIKEANQYYDYLDRCFENYNRALKQEYGISHPNYETLYLDKRPYLDIFFNKYCYQSSNNFIRSFIFFIYPLNVLSRGLKFLWATITNKPCMKHQIVKNFSKDMVIISQIIGPLARMMADFNLYMTGTLRGLFFLTVLPIALALYLIFFVCAKASNLLFHMEAPITPFSHVFEYLDDGICYLIALHKTPELYLIRQLFVRVSRVAGTNQDIAHATEKLYQDLNEIGVHIRPHHHNTNMLHTLQPKRLPAIHQENWSEDTFPKLFDTHTPAEVEENMHNEALIGLDVHILYK